MFPVLNGRLHFLSFDFLEKWKKMGENFFRDILSRSLLDIELKKLHSEPSGYMGTEEMNAKANGSSRNSLMKTQNTNVTATVSCG